MQPMIAPHSARFPHAVAAEQHDPARHVLWQGSLEVMPPHEGPLSELPNWQAVAHGPVRQLSRAFKSLVPFGCAVEHASRQLASPSAHCLLHAKSAAHSALFPQAAPWEQQPEEKQVSHADVLKLNPPHDAPASPGAALPPQAASHSPVMQPVNEFNACSPPGFSSMHPCEHASSLQACTQWNAAEHAAFAPHADPCEQHEPWMHALQRASDAPNPPHTPPWLLLPVVALLEHAATRTAIARQTTNHCTLGRTTTPSSPRAPSGRRVAVTTDRIQRRHLT